MAETSEFRRHALLPKSNHHAKPAIPALPHRELNWLACELGPAERRALREIAQGADLTEVDGAVYLIAPVSAETVDALAAFEVEGEDRESDDLEDEPGTDDEPSIGNGSVGLPCYVDCELDTCDDEDSDDDRPDHRMTAADMAIRGFLAAKREESGANTIDALILDDNSGTSGEVLRGVPFR